MRKLILTALTCAAFTISNAQTNDSSASGASFGIKGGVNFSNLYTEDVDDNNVLTSFNVGVFVSMPLTNFLSIQPEFLYSRKGAELVYDNAFASGTGKFKLNYIEAPILLKVNLTKNLNVHAGPYFAYLIDAQVTNESGSGNFDFEENIDNDDFNKFDYGISAGAGFDFESIGFGVRYNYGLSTVGKERSFLGTTYTFPDGKNSNLSIYAAYKF
ncbi:PorT family protein [Flavobacterium azooxidireducens]|uniref:PorT family protein n=1 Tax=Flavobacterium azooxidireducens TaxID=1871076 RepID=A0ABY4KIN4_9FLAO|nr:porin family protein [Flavobacterium azooxidireducens]UPQ79618.1 PorT family protein [Flavobacterium azooxidireducens]